MRKVFISPHNDDEALFGAFTIMRYREDVEVAFVYDSYVQVNRGHIYCSTANRRAESLEALAAMGVSEQRVKFLGLRDDADVNINEISGLIRQFSGAQLWFPAYEDGGNKHHNAVSMAVRHSLASPSKTAYLTYTDRGKSIGENLVVPSKWSDVAVKLIALSCYHTQIEIADCRPHFLRGQEEYYL